MADVEFDKDGFLLNLEQWQPSIANNIALQEGITLSDEHWEVIQLIRQFYGAYHISPAMRPLVKYVKQHLGDSKGESLHLLRLFPGSPAKLAAKIAGLPRPANCL